MQTSARRGRLLVSTLILALTAAACAGGDPASTEPDGSADGPRTVTVDVDGVSDGSNVALLGYFPRQVTVRQGDTVRFAFEPGDPHTVTFGAIVDEAFAAMADGPPDGPPPEAAMKLPGVFSEDGQSLVATGTLPCFTVGDPPTDGSPCEGEQEAFDGSHGIYSSGLLAPEDEFAVQVAADAAPGTYSYFCLLHGPQMSGEVTIVGADDEAPTAEDVAATGAAERAALLEAAGETLAAQPQGTLPGFEELLPSGPGHVLSGGIYQGDYMVDILQFGPAEVTIAAGESVTWTVLGPHTISFEAPQDATPPVIAGPDGLPALNPLAFAPQGGAAGPPPPPEGEGPPEPGPPGPPTVIDGGTWDGAGFFSSGFIPSFPPNLLAYEVTFSTAGTYPYVCLIHPGMEGTVNVT